jgi:hypothetical protein
MKPIKKMCNECPYKKGIDITFAEIGLGYDNVKEFFDGKPVHSCHKIKEMVSPSETNERIGCKGSILFYEKNILGHDIENIKTFEDMS